MSKNWRHKCQAKAKNEELSNKIRDIQLTHEVKNMDQEVIPTATYNVRINITLWRVSATIVAVENQ